MLEELLRIGGCEEGDIPEMVAIERESFPSPWTENLLRQERTNPIARVLVGRMEGLPGTPVAGYLIYWLVADEMQIHNLAVRKDQRRKGIATRLLREAIQTSEAEGVQRATLEVRRSNLPARNLYEKIGFLIQGVRLGYYSDTGEDALILWGERGRFSPEQGQRSFLKNRENDHG